MAEFESPDDLLKAVRNAREAGYHKMDAFTPLPIEGLAEALEFHRIELPPIVLVGGMIGGVLGYALQYYISVIAYPVNVGGRPLNSWPAFIPVTFEVTILFAAFSAVLGMLALNGLPQPYHPVFNVPEFALATRDRFFLCIEATDPQFDTVETRGFIESLHPRHISEVPH
ncbi:MAG: DUF3341 domain-containing protein [Acidobacteria bacterium]|nr:DUF3341 domain-containing protein [Acidobacteriota bacterium]